MKFYERIYKLNGDLYYINRKDNNKPILYNLCSSELPRPVILFRDPSVANRYIKKISDYLSERLNLDKDLDIEVCKLDRESSICNRYGIIIKEADNTSVTIESISELEKE